MPALAGAIGAIIVGLIGFFAKWMTKRIAAVAAAVVAILAVVGTFVTAIEGLIAGITYTAPEITGSIDQASADAIAETGVDDHISGIGDSEIGTDAVGDSGNILKNALPADGSCTELRTELIEGKFFEISCEDTSRLREVLSWVFYISTVWYLFNLVTNPPTKGLK